MADTTVGDLDWKLDANCRGTDPVAFFPDDGAPSYEAKRICQRCSVRAECLDYAVTEGIRWGIWGGTNETARKALIREHKKRKAAA